MNKNKLPTNYVTCLTASILAEAVAWPTPGLVSSISNGAHNDMNIFTFLISSLSLLEFFNQAFSLGKNNDKCNTMDLAMQLRKIGLAAEAAMLEETQGINTHKGTIFLGLIFCAAVGIVSKQEKLRDLNQICFTTFDIGRHLVAEDLANLKHKKISDTSIGLKAYSLYGTLGIRDEIINKCQNILDIGVNSIKENLEHNPCLRLALVQTLLNFMAVIDDTTLLNRKFDINRIKFVKATATKIIANGGVYSEEGIGAIKAAEATFKKMSLSPGGSADLTCISLSLFCWKYGYPQGFLNYVR